MNLISHFVSQALTSPINSPAPKPMAVRNRQKNRDEGIKQIVAHLRKHGEMSTKNLATDMKMKPDAALKWCNHAMKQGLLTKDVRTGSSDGSGGLTNVAFWRTVAVIGVWGV